MKLSRKPALVVVAIVAIVGLLIARNQFYYPITNESASNGPVIALGDSLTYGTGAGKGEDWPSLVGAMCGCDIINKGVPGDTTEDALRRLQNDVLDLNPRMVIVGLGGNDVLRKLPRDRMFKNLESIVTQIQGSGAMVVVLGLNGFPLGGELAAGYKKVARDTGSVYVSNLLGGVFSNPAMKADQIHPNAAGYRVIADRIYGKVKPYL